QAQAEEAVVWVAPGEPTRHGPEAIARMLVDAGSYWRPLGRLLGLRPVLWVAWPVYRWVARNRHRMPGGTSEPGPRATGNRSRAQAGRRASRSAWGREQAAVPPGIRCRLRATHR
ncbi:MAG TPA: DCC1-like thiol-disulfide oxidoreductase family protein, partial [Actinomycetes bacterium]|nr:DCC1-like thiol-disulfide oxidoreductase family protein [Actinomycetes bacterium]